MTEYIGYSDPIGGGLCNMGLTDTEVVRCRDFKHFREEPMADGTKSHRCSGMFAFAKCRPDGFCAWAERRGA